MANKKNGKEAEIEAERREEIIVTERGDGLPDRGEIVLGPDDIIYRIIDIIGPIMISDRSGRGNQQRYSAEHIGDVFDISEAEYYLLRIIAVEVE